MLKDSREIRNSVFFMHIECEDEIKDVTVVRGENLEINSCDENAKQNVKSSLSV